MKKALIAPICSAFIIPGLGQIINGHLKKGALILAALTVLFVLGVYKLYRMVEAALDKGGGAPPDLAALMDSIRAQDPSALLYLATAFAILWVYSVVDAAVAGSRQDRIDRGENQ